MLYGPSGLEQLNAAEVCEADKALATTFRRQVRTGDEVVVPYNSTHVKSSRLSRSIIECAVARQCFSGVLGRKGTYRKDSACARCLKFWVSSTRAQTTSKNSYSSLFFSFGVARFSQSRSTADPTALRSIGRTSAC